MGRNNDRPTVYETMQREAEEIARELLRQKPRGTTLIDVWEEALAIQRRRHVSRTREEKGTGRGV